MKTIGIAGLGLMGGSLARDLTAQGYRVLGFDQAGRPDSLPVGRLDHDRITECDTLVLALPVDQNAEYLRQIANHATRLELITDVGSTKRRINALAEELRLPNFVGSHPFTGDHRSGPGAARADLFRGVRVFLTPTAISAAAALAAARTLWATVGASVRVVEADAHDTVLAFSSHLPQVVSTALAGVFARVGMDRTELGPGGRDLTRLAQSNPQMWTAILLENADHITTALELLGEEVAALRQALAERDEAAIRAAFTTSMEWSERPASSG